MSVAVLVVRAGGLADPRGLGCHAIRMREVVGRGDVLVLAPAEQRRQSGQEPRRVAERPVHVEVEFEEVFAQEDHDLGPGQDADVGRQPELERVLADDPVAERVEGADRRVRVAVRHELVDPDGHLLGRLVGERQGEDLGRLRSPGRDEPCDPARDDLGLAGARPRDDEQRPGPMRDRAQLVRVQPAKQRFESRRRLRLRATAPSPARARSRPAADRAATAHGADGHAVVSR